MMFVLLQVLLPELEDPASGEELPNDTGASRSDRPNEKITAVAARVFPALRQYSVWLASGAGLILTSAGTASIQVHAKEMWKMYADVLTRLTNFFPVAELASVSYLLEEDESTVGFQPLRNPQLSAECNLYIDAKGELKPRITDLGVKRDLPHVEMQARVLNILLCGLSLQLKEQIPLALGNDTGSPVFTFVEEGLSLASPVRIQESTSAYTSPMRTNGSYGAHPPTNETYEVREESIAASDSHHSMDTDMHRMVDSLLEPPSSSRNATSNETSYGMHSATANEIFAPLGSNGFESRFQSTPKMLPSLPGLYNSAFTPQPNELQPHSPIRPMTARQLSPLSLATPEQRLQAAVALDELTGYGPTKNGSWGRGTSRPLSNPVSQPVNQVLQQSLAQQFMPMSSSAFSDSSSIYANNTPQLQQRVAGGHLHGGLPVINGNNSTVYAGISDFDKTTMLQSSIYDGSQPVLWGGYAHQTPPGGQGG
jgi:Est1 DNA/RNA binding domain